MSDNPPVRFVRTPSERVAASFLTEDATYLAHSVMSKRHAPQGMTFDEIMDDHLNQAAADECTPFDHETGALLLVECIEAGLVSTLDTRPAPLSSRTATTSNELPPTLWLVA